MLHCCSLALQCSRGIFLSHQFLDFVIVVLKYWNQHSLVLIQSKQFILYTCRSKNHIILENYLLSFYNLLFYIFKMTINCSSLFTNTLNFRPFIRPPFRVDVFVVAKIKSFGKNCYSYINRAGALSISFGSLKVKENG
jgi:hypothetical protein